MTATGSVRQSPRKSSKLSCRAITHLDPVRTMTLRARVETRKISKAAAMANLVTAALSLPGSMGFTTSPYFPTTCTSSLQGPACSSKSPEETRTASFDALWAGNFPNVQNNGIKVHTLILGTHPSIKSLEGNRYYDHPMNAFWWIAGDCLGFRRASGITKSGQPYKFTTQLRHDLDKVIPYDLQTELLASHGFALWDVVQSCQRKGSLDSCIRNEVPNDIRSFCEAHPTVKRIVFANGVTGSTIFKKHFKEWLETGQLKPGPDETSQKTFGALAKKANNSEKPTITCVCAISVSPAAASYSYAEKRDFWETHVYQPGLNEITNLV